MKRAADIGNVLYIVNCLSVGGAQKALLNLLQSDMSQQYPPLVITLIQAKGMQKAFQQAGIPLLELDIKRLSGLLLCPWRLWKAVRNVRPVVIQGWLYYGNMVAVLAWLFAGCRPRLLWSIHHTPVEETFQRSQHAMTLTLGKWLSGLPDTIVYVSKRSQQYHRQFGYSAQRDCVIPNGIELPVPDDMDTRKRLYKEWGLEQDVPVIGSLTRFVEAKDIPNLVTAIHLFIGSGGRAYFVLAGEGMNVGNIPLQALLDKAGCRDYIRLLGVRQDAGQVIAAMDIATLSSSREALPLFLLEAMAAAVPCVATDVGDVAECLGDTGKVVLARSPAQLAAAWAELLALPEAQRMRLGQIARQRVAGHFSLQAVVDAHHALFAGNKCPETL